MSQSPDTREMFSRIAGRYDLVNTVLSLGMDGLWRRRSVSRVLARPGLTVLDLCAGTGKIALTCAQDKNKPARVIAADFAEPMLVLAQRAIERQGQAERIPVVCADSLAVPIARATCDVVTCAFGVRNLADLDLGLSEMARCLRQGGRVLILEFLNPGRRRLFRFFSWWVKVVLPALGGLISGSRDAYAYLPASIDRFVTREELTERLCAAGFSNVEMSEFMGGVCTAVFATRE